MRIYLNLEVKQLRTLLALLAEIEFDRNLTKSERFLRDQIKEGLDKARQV